MLQEMSCSLEQVRLKLTRHFSSLWQGHTPGRGVPGAAEAGRHSNREGDTSEDQFKHFSSRAAVAPQLPTAGGQRPRLTPLFRVSAGKEG